MSKPIGMLPANAPIDNNGTLLAPEWYMLFQYFFIRMGGSIAQSNNELTIGQLDDAGIEEIKLQLYALQDQLNSALATIQQISDYVDSAPAPIPQAYGDYNPASVAITGGTIAGVSINSSAIGATTPSTATFTDLTNGNVAALIKTSVAMNNGAAAAAGTISNAPAAGNPTKWIPINDNGTVRYVPAW